MAQMSPTTTNDLLRLQVYGSMYLSGIEPANIELALRNHQLSFQGLERAIGDLSGKQQYNAAGDIVLSVLGAIGGLAQTIPVAGAVIGAVFGVVVGIIRMVRQRQLTTACDSGGCLPGAGDDPADWRSGEEWRNRRGIVGLNVPTVAKELDDFSCRIEHYGGSSSACKARWAYLVSYMNDGMWWWGRLPGHEDLLNGTVIGVMGKVDNGETKGCHKRYYGRKDTPKHAGIDHFRDRQNAVTQVLTWMMFNMDYGVLSCLENMIHNNEGEGQSYWVCNTGDPRCNEASIAHLMGVPGDNENFGSGNWPYNRKLTSRVYASVRGMFQGLVQMSKKIGIDKAQAILREVGAKTAAEKLPLVAKLNAGPWPEKDIADHMTWYQLKEALDMLSMETVATINAETAAAAASSRSMSYAHAFDKVMSAKYSVDPRSLPPIGRTGFFGLPWWTTYVGAGALVLTGGGIVLAARKKD